MKTIFHNKNFALRLALKRRQTWTRKWLIRYARPILTSNTECPFKSNNLLPIFNNEVRVNLPVYPYQVQLWSSQLWTQLLQLRKEAWKFQDFNGVWTRELAVPVRHSNQLSYEATDVGSWLFVGSKCSREEWIKDEMIYEMDHIWTTDIKPSEAMILALMNAITGRL